MRKAKLILAVALLALVFGAQAAMAGSIETLVNQQGADGKTDSTYLTITREDIGGGLWHWVFTVHNGADRSPYLHTFTVGLAVDDTPSGVTDGHYLNYGSSITSATVQEFSQRVLWNWSTAEMGVGSTASFWFDTDLGSVTELIHEARNGSYSARWSSVATPTATPEPGSIALLLTGVAGMAGAFVRRIRPSITD